MKRGARFYNIGRGSTVDQPALIAALQSGQLGGAYLDVMEPEPLPPGHWMWRHPRVWLTPHIASMTQPESAVEVVLENLRRFEHGVTMVGQVDRARGY